MVGPIGPWSRQLGLYILLFFGGICAGGLQCSIQHWVKSLFASSLIAAPCIFLVCFDAKLTIYSALCEPVIHLTYKPFPIRPTSRINPWWSYCGTTFVNASNISGKARGRFWQDLRVRWVGPSRRSSLPASEDTAPTSYLETSVFCY